jgi:hypothetical protein
MFRTFSEKFMQMKRPESMENREPGSWCSLTFSDRMTESGDAARGNQDIGAAQRVTGRNTLSGETPLRAEPRAVKGMEPVNR